MRKILFWFHLLAGVTAGVVILIMSVTGLLLGFERQIIAWADHRNLPPVDSRAGWPLPAEDLLAAARKVTSDAAATLTLHRESAASAEVAFGRELVLLINPYTGAVLGEGSAAVRGFFEAVTSWHRYLGAAGTHRDAGRAVTGAANLLFLLIISSGPFLWLPRRWNWQTVRAALLFRGGLGGRARDWNWHNVAGIWCALPLFLIVLSSVVMSYPWANNLLYRITGNEPPAQQARRGGGGEGRRERQEPWTGLDRLVNRAKEQSPAWRTISVRLAPGSTVALTIDEGTGGEPQKRSQLTVDRKTAEVVRWEPFAANNAGRKARSLARFIHTGEAGGLAGQAIATVACGAASLLVWTGIALALRRFFSWRARRSPSRDRETAQYSEVG